MFVRLGARTRIVAERCCWLSTQTSRAPEVIPAIAANTPTLTEWRRDFHMHPELGFEEFRTSALVASRLTEMGIKVTTGMAGTGVVGTLTGNGSCSVRTLTGGRVMVEEGSWEFTGPPQQPPGWPLTPGRLYGASGMVGS